MRLTLPRILLNIIFLTVTYHLIIVPRLLAHSTLEERILNGRSIEERNLNSKVVYKSDEYYCYEITIGKSIQQYAGYSHCDKHGVFRTSSESYEIGTYETTYASTNSTSSKQVYSKGTYCPPIKKHRSATLEFIRDDNITTGHIDISISEIETCTYSIELRLAPDMVNASIVEGLALTNNAITVDLPIPVQPLPPVQPVAITETAEKCEKRDVSSYDDQRYRNELPESLINANCLTFHCTKYSDNVTDTCNSTLPTNYDGSDPPCCNHILRDMARLFDNRMCNLGLDYLAAYGTLLGLMRSDHLIPWTFDCDYTISANTANALVDLWDAHTTGMSYMFQDIPRMCVTPAFANGKLVKWKKNPKETHLWDAGSPYIDFYVGSTLPNGKFSEFQYCYHNPSDVWPSKRVKVYGGNFSHNFPANHEQVIKTYYGPKWKIPDNGKNPHGTCICGSGTPCVPGYHK